MDIVKASYRISEAELASVLFPYTIERVPGIFNADFITEI
jgi:hypothetical protein